MRFLMVAMAICMLGMFACTQIQTSKSTSTAEAVGSSGVIVKHIISVYDADTFRVALNDWPAYLGDDIGIRVRGIDAPEIRGKCDSEKVQARESRDYVRARLKRAGVVSLQNIKPGKYFRLVADVELDGALLSRELIQKGYARPYDGGRRKGWC